jgi:hypothetical protein
MDITKRYIDDGGYIWEFHHGVWGFRFPDSGNWRATLYNAVEDIIGAFGPMEEITAAATVDGIEGEYV